MADIIQRAMLMNGMVAVSAAKTDTLVNEAIRLHRLSPVMAAALGRTLTGAAFMSLDLKNPEDSLTVTIKGDGPAGGIVVSGEQGGKVRGYVENPYVMLPLSPKGKLDVGGAVGKNGRMSVVKSMGLKKPYVGQVELVSGEIAEDFASYYATSEQKPTAVALGVLIEPAGTCLSAGGVLCHALPGASDEVLAEIERAMAKLSNISAILLEHSPQSLIEEYFPGPAAFTEELVPEYRCKCSVASIEKVLLSLGKAEAEKILAESGCIEIQCHFCEKKYRFTGEDVFKLFG